MAEIVGAVASGFTLAGVAVGSARTVIRLRQLWSEVKEVPQAIQGLILKVELFESIILEMEQTATATPSDRELALGPDSAIARSTEHCQRQLKGLSDLINDLEAAITAQKHSRRVFNKVKVALGGSRLAEFERRMRDVVDTLTISMAARNLAVAQMNLRQTSSFSRTLTHQVEIISPGQIMDDNDDGERNRQRVASDTVGSAVLKSTHGKESGQEQIISKPTSTSSESSIGLMHRTLGGVLFKKRSTEAGVLSESEFGVEARAPTWLYGTAFKFQVTRARGAWATLFRCYNVRPWDSIVFNFAREGNFQAVLALIEQKQASVYDTDYWGEGILHMLFQSPKIDLQSVSSLLAAGADLYLEDISNSTPSQLWLASPESPGEGVYEFFSSMGAFDEDDSYSIFQFLWNATIFRAEGEAWYAGKFTSRASKEVALHHYGPVMAVLFPHLMTRSDLRELRSILEIQVKQNTSGILSLWFGISTAVVSTKDARFTDSFDFVVEVLRALDSIHSITPLQSLETSESAFCRFATPFDNQRLSPLLHFLSGAWVYSCSQTKDCLAKTAVGIMDRQLERWLWAIEEAGYSLNEYGRIESASWRSGPLRFTRWGRVAWRDVWIPGIGWYGGRSVWSNRLKIIPFTAPKLVDIQYGPGIGDWKLVWDMDVEEMVGEFWCMLEDLQRPLPGSWDPSWAHEPEHGLVDHSDWDPEEDDNWLVGQAYAPVGDTY